MIPFLPRARIIIFGALSLRPAGVPEAGGAGFCRAETEPSLAEAGLSGAKGSGSSSVTTLPLPSTVAERGSTARTVHPEARSPNRTPEAVCDDWS